MDADNEYKKLYVIILVLALVACSGWVAAWFLPHAVWYECEAKYNNNTDTIGLMYPNQTTWGELYEENRSKETWTRKTKGIQEQNQDHHSLSQNPSNSDRLYEGRPAKTQGREVCSTKGYQKSCRTNRHNN